MMELDFDTLRLKLEDLITDYCDSWIDLLPNEVSLTMDCNEDFNDEIRETMMHVISDQVNLKL